MPQERLTYMCSPYRMQGSFLVLLALVGFAAAQVQLNLEFEYLNKFGNIKVRLAQYFLKLKFREKLSG